MFTTMWIHTDTGFVSVVQHDDNHSILLVRARARRDLDTFVEDDARIWRDPNADYPWRATLTRKEFAAVMADKIDKIDYGNFKSRTDVSLGPARTGLLHRVWSTLTGIEDVEEPELAADRWTSPIGVYHSAPLTAYLDELDDDFGMPDWIPAS